MVVSNEPGYYEDGAFGIRIENLLVIREEPTPNRFGGQAFLGFERLTLCPLQRKMIALEARPCFQSTLTLYLIFRFLMCPGGMPSPPRHQLPPCFGGRAFWSASRSASMPRKYSQ